MDVFESSTREKMPAVRSFVAACGEHGRGRGRGREGRTDMEDEGVKLVPGTEGDDEDLCGCDDGGEREHGAVDVLLAGPEDVFEEGVENAAKAERGFDDVGGVLAHYVIGQRADPRAKRERRTGLLERLALDGHEIARQRDLPPLRRDRRRPV